MNTVPAAVKVVRMPLSLLQLVGKLQLHCLQLKLAVWRSLITQKTCSSAINSRRADGLSLFVSTKNNLNYFITYAYIYIHIININPATPSKPVGCSRPLRRNLISLVCGFARACGAYEPIHAQGAWTECSPKRLLN